MNRIFIYLITLFFFGQSSAQEITIYGQRQLWHAENLCDIYHTGCDWRTLNQGAMLGYAHHPNGQLWLVTNHDYIDDYARIKIFKLDIGNCNYTFLQQIDLPKYWNSVSGINIDYLGRLYLVMLEWDTIANEGAIMLSRYTITSGTPVYERLLRFVPNQRVNEVHFENGKVYLPETDKPFIRVYDTNFFLVDTIPTSKHIWGLTTFSFGCDSAVTYTTHMRMSTEEYQANGAPDSVMYISKIDLDNNVLTPVCDYVMGDKAANTQLTSPLEFLSSDPACDLLIDLDLDNSSGLYPYDFRDTVVSCSLLSGSVCDEDVYVHTSVPLDSIQIRLSDIRDPGFEQIIMSGMVTGINLISRDDSTYMLSGMGSSDSLFREALLSLRYQHNGPPRTGGIRQIIFRGYSPARVGVQIQCDLHINGLPYAGTDYILSLCGDTIIGNFTELTGGHTGGYWSPVLTSGAQLFNSLLDQDSVYNYIVTDPDCGSDTSTIRVIHLVPSYDGLLGEDKVLCPGDSLMITIQDTGLDVIWEDGSMTESRIITTPGDYWIKVNEGDCAFTDSIHIQEGQVWIPEIEVLDAHCGIPDGVIRFDSMQFTIADQVLINDSMVTAHEISSLPSGEYRVTGISQDGCISEYIISLKAYPPLVISMDSVFTIPEGQWEVIPFLVVQGGEITEVRFDPVENIRFSNPDIEAFGREDLVYKVTFVDDWGCEDVRYFIIDTEEENGIYFPNIFHPQSGTGNAVWRVIINPPYEFLNLKIYDRWGSLVHQSKTQPEWDGTFKGKNCAMGVYAYLVMVKDTRTGELKHFIGDLSILR